MWKKLTREHIHSLLHVSVCSDVSASVSAAVFTGTWRHLQSYDIWKKWRQELWETDSRHQSGKVHLCGTGSWGDNSLWMVKCWLPERTLVLEGAVATSLSGVSFRGAQGLLWHRFWRGFWFSIATNVPCINPGLLNCHHLLPLQGFCHRNAPPVYSTSLSCSCWVFHREWWLYSWPSCCRGSSHEEFCCMLLHFLHFQCVLHYPGD